MYYHGRRTRGGGGRGGWEALAPPVFAKFLPQVWPMPTAPSRSS